MARSIAIGSASMGRAQKAAKAERRKKYQWIFMNGKQVRIKRPPTIDGMDVDEFIRRNADPIWLHQNEMWEYIDQQNNLRNVIGGSVLDSYIYNFCGDT